MEAQVRIMNKEIVEPRKFKCILWSIIAQLFTTSLAAYILGIESSKSYFGFSFYAHFCTFTFWLHTVLLTFPVICFAISHVRLCSVKWEEFTSRWHLVWTLTKPVHLVVILLHTIVATLAARWYLCLVDDDSVNSLTKPTSCRRFVCYNEMNLFLLLSGAYCSFTYACDYFLSKRNFLRFPIIQISLWVQIKSCIVPLLKNSVRKVVQRLKWFFLAYMFFGFYARTSVGELLSIKRCEGVRLNSLNGLMQFKLVWIVVWQNALLYLTWDLVILLSRLFLTEHREFSVETNPPIIEEDKFQLRHAMAVRNNPLIQHLAYHDFSLLMNMFPERRKALFMLSVPGGHPSNFKAVFNECLALLDELTNSFRSTYNASKQQATKPTFIAEQKVYDRVRVPPMIGIRLWVQRKLFQLKENILENCYLLRATRIFTFKVAEQSTCQPHIWAVQGLTNLTVASLCEDKFGVVQQYLVDIIGVLCALKTELSGQMNRASRNSYQSQQERLQRDLVGVVDTSLFMIAAQFRHHLAAIGLSPECQRILQNYSSCIN